MSPLNITQPLGIWSIMATIRWCPIFPKWDIYQPLLFFLVFKKWEHWVLRLSNHGTSCWDESLDLRRGDWHCHQDGATDVKSNMRPKYTEMFVLYMVSYSWFNGGMSKTKRMECEPMRVLAWSFKTQEVPSLFLAVDWWSRGGHTIYLVQWCSRENHPKWSTQKNQHKCP